MLLLVFIATASASASPGDVVNEQIAELLQSLAMVLGGPTVLGLVYLGLCWHKEVGPFRPNRDSVVEAAGPNEKPALVTETELKRAIAESDAGMLAVQAAVTPGATRQTIALAAYALCIQGAQGKGEGSAAFGCTKRGEALDTALLAIPSCPEPVESE